MTKNNVLEFAGRDTISDPLTALLRSGAQQLITQAVEAEVRRHRRAPGPTGDR